MRLVIDANILIAALLKNATTREIIFEEDTEFFAPECLLLEIETLLKNPRIRRRIKLKDSELSELSSEILSRITFFPELHFKNSIKQSMSLVSHIEDAAYIALSLVLKIPLWSNDAALKEQTLAKVFNTPELIKLLRA